MFNRWIETEGLLDQAAQSGTGIVAFTPLCQGLLTSKYLAGVTPDSRAAKGDTLTGDEISMDVLTAVKALNGIAQERGQSLAQMALSWSLRDPRVTSLIIGASRPNQVAENVVATTKLDFSEQDLRRIDEISEGIYINPWHEALEY
jgi:L-glyceraldehyde 3-phosphate reductase